MDSPLVGVGPMNFGRWFSDYYRQYADKAPERMWGRAAHSMFVTLLSETGLLGSALFIAIIAYMWRTHRFVVGLNDNREVLADKLGVEPDVRDGIEKRAESFQAISYGILGAMIGYLVTGIFISILWYGYLWKLLAYSAALGAMSRQFKETFIEEDIVGGSP